MMNNMKLLISVLVPCVAIFDWYLLDWLLPKIDARFLIYSEVNRMVYSGHRLLFENEKKDDIRCPSISLNDVGTADEFYTNYILPRKPVRIITGSLSALGWNMEKWTLPALQATLGDRVVNVEKINSTSSFGHGSEKVDISFTELVDLWQKSNSTEERYYMNLQRGESKRSMVPPLSLLSTIFTLPSFFLSNPITAINLWMGKAEENGSSSMLHHDSGDNLYMLVAGKKTFRYFAPSDAFDLYTKGHVDYVSPSGNIRYAMPFLYSDPPHFSPINPLFPNLTTHPRFAAATMATCELEAGDLLYLPGGWFHHVTSFGENIAVNVWATFLTEE